MKPMYCKECKGTAMIEELESKGYFAGWRCHHQHEGRDITEFHLHAYYGKCKDCNNTQILYTQSDSSPEYYTEVSMLCNECSAGLIEFSLPVN